MCKRPINRFRYLKGVAMIVYIYTGHKVCICTYCQEIYQGNRRPSEIFNARGALSPLRKVYYMN